MDLSVIICTHNPREDYLKRVLDALDKQTLPKDRWELLLIDNASKQPLAGKWDLSWHPHFLHIREDELGLTPARIRGIQESKGELLVFVDDDNVLAVDYLEKSEKIVESHLFLGAIGGQILPEYEIEPPDWLKERERILAIRSATGPRWSNAWDDWQSQPWGAGMALLRSVCEHYISLIKNDPRRSGMDRKGGSLFSGGDTDMVLCCPEIGLGHGVFPELIVTHLIPRGRMEESYAEKITRGLKVSNLWLKHIRNQPYALDFKRNWYTHLRAYYHFLKRSQIQRKLEEAALAGQEDFLDMLAKEKYLNE